MGKRNKFSKIGISRKNHLTLLKAKKKLLQNKNMNVTMNKTRVEEEDDEMEVSSDENMNTTKIKDKSFLNKSKLNQTFVNEEKVDRQSSIMGIDKETLMSVMQNPLRNRRQITNVVLSKGQRKRQEKKDKFKRKVELVEKIKLNNSMINASQLNKTNNNVTINNLKEKKKDFDLGDIDNTLAMLMNDIQQGKDETGEENVASKKFTTHRTKRNLKKILNEEKEKLKKVVLNKNYQLNPLEAMKDHIKNSQMVAERNKRVEENFQKNYNFLNIKK